MNNNKMAQLCVVALSLTALMTGCGKDDEDRREAFEQNQLEPGTFASERCFKNKIETQVTVGVDRFSTARLTFNADGTGSGSYGVFSDAGCTALVATRDFIFSQVTIGPLNGATVMRLNQSGAGPVWWIPMNLAGGGYSLDVDFTDGESGPYLVEPSAAEMSSFIANPGQGVAFTKE